MSDVIKPPIHGRDHRPGGSDPIPLAISMAKLKCNSQSLSASGSSLNFGTITSTYDAGGHFGVSSGNFKIVDAGLYALHFEYFGLSTATDKNTTVFLDLSVSSGSTGLWSSSRTSVGGAGMAAVWATWIDSATTVGVEADGDGSANCYVALPKTGTYPVVLDCYVQVAEDGVGVGKTISAYLTGVRLGAADE